MFVIGMEVYLCCGRGWSWGSTKAVLSHRDGCTVHTAAAHIVDKVADCLLGLSPPRWRVAGVCEGGCSGIALSAYKHMNQTTSYLWTLCE